ncbi:hypothetical protein AD006_30750 (plasmid) [Pseudonocardia sp. EC080610-09]|uniref:hypothetical protein n=1 Tax=unclassified Pseudonocardia TaxID=2619320 RepID=UPI0007060FE2|nr:MULTISPECIES: hypothetical protein [unclassified Pseudonocardia]ALL79586.1 hypothetical protein AD006_30750 [Pseudonocardia sp. EC080610-09]ALL85460.1 hypothetical protein AD017_30490 [Pseudonocardia sp. EC080619-01]
MNATVVALSSSAATAVGAHLARGLVGRDAEVVLAPGSVVEFTRADLLVVAVTVSGRHADPEVIRLLRDADLAGATAFVAAVGAWPSEVQTADRDIRPLLLRAGATCLAPVLHVVDDSAAPIDRFCRFWSPVVPGLVAGQFGLAS